MVIALDIQHKIENKEYAGRLPSERKLCDYYGVSRNTINQALNYLEKKEIIFRKRGSGNYIRNTIDIDKYSETNVHDFTDGFTDAMKADNKSVETKVIDFQMVLASHNTAKKLHIEPQQPLFKVVRLRIADGKKVVHETNVIPISLLPNITPKIMEGSFFQYATETLNRKITDASIEVTAPLASDEVQKELDMPDQNPVVIQTQAIIMLEDGVPLEFVDTYHLPEVFTLHTHANG